MNDFINSPTKRLSCTLFALFAIASLAVVGESQGLAPIVTKFVEFPLVLSCHLILLIWLGLGVQHPLTRLSLTSVCLTFVFFLTCFDWLYLFDTPWNRFHWAGFFGFATACMLTYMTPITGILVSLVLGWLRRDSDAKAQVSIRGLLFSVACFAVALMMWMAVPAYKRWGFDYLRELIGSVDETTDFVLLFLFPSLVATILSYAALAIWWKRPRSYFAISAFILALSCITAVSHFAANRLIWDGLVFEWWQVAYMAAQNVLTVVVLVISLFGLGKSIVGPAA